MLGKIKKIIINNTVHAFLDFRSFDFMSPWEGAKYILPGYEKAEENSAGKPD